MTHGETILLRLLARKDMYGYELNHIIDENRMRQWADIGFSSIYNSLNKLERHGYVGAYRAAESGGPARKVYRITDAGREALHEAVVVMLKEPRKVHDDFGVALVCSDVLSDDEFRDSLKAYRSQLVEKRRMYEQEMPETSTRKDRVARAIDRARRLLDAEIGWLDAQ